LAGAFLAGAASFFSPSALGASAFFSPFLAATGFFAASSSTFIVVAFFGASWSVLASDSLTVGLLRAASASVFVLVAIFSKKLVLRGFDYFFLSRCLISS
jgi:hypothetical protein